MITYIKYEKDLLKNKISFMRRATDGMMRFSVTKENMNISRILKINKILKKYILHDITLEDGRLYQITYVHKKYY